MKFISWNVNGFRAVLNKGFDEIFLKLDADFFSLQETKMKEGQTSFAPEGYVAYYAYAEKAGYSKQTLIHKFRERYGKTPIEYLTAVRINQAKLLLVNTHRSVGQIAKLCGYENTYYFSNTFKKQVQMSPLQFRQKSII